VYHSLREAGCIDKDAQSAWVPKAAAWLPSKGLTDCLYPSC
jgi:hypothetical protein